MKREEALELLSRNVWLESGDLGGKGLEQLVIYDLRRIVDAYVVLLDQTERAGHLLDLLMEEVAHAETCREHCFDGQLRTKTEWQAYWDGRISMVEDIEEIVTAWTSGDPRVRAQR